MPVVEFWVMRVLLHPGPMRRPVKLDDMNATEQMTTLLAVQAGSYGMLPNGSIVEPVEVFTTEEDAHEHRAKLASDKPSEDYRVILNTDVTV